MFNLKIKIMTTSQHHYLNNYKEIIKSNLDYNLDRLSNNLIKSDKSKEEVAFDFISTEMKEFNRIGSNIEGFLDVDRNNDLSTILIDYTLKYYNIDVYELQFDFS